MSSIDRRTAMLQMGALTGAVLLSDKLAAEGFPPAKPLPQPRPRRQPDLLPCRLCPMPTTRWSRISTPQPCICTTTSTTRPT